MTKIITSIYRVHDQDTNLHLVDDQDTNLHENITKILTSISYMTKILTSISYITKILTSISYMTKILTSISYMTRRPASNLRTCPAVQLQVESTQGTAVVHRVIQISRTIQDTVVYMQGDTNI